MTPGEEEPVVHRTMASQPSSLEVSNSTTSTRPMMTAAATEVDGSHISIHSSSSEVSGLKSSDLEVKASVVTSSAASSKGSRQRRIRLANEMELMKAEERRLAIEERKAAMEERKLRMRFEMQEIDEEDARQRLTGASSQSPSPTSRSFPPGLDAARFNIGTPPGAPQSGDPVRQQQQQPPRHAIRSEPYALASSAPSTPRKRPPEMALLGDGLQRSQIQGGQSIASSVVESHSPSSAAAFNIAVQVVHGLGLTPPATNTSRVVDPAAQMKRPPTPTVLPTRVEEPYEEDRLKKRKPSPGPSIPTAVPPPLPAASSTDVGIQEMLRARAALENEIRQRQLIEAQAHQQIALERQHAELERVAQEQRLRAEGEAAAKAVAAQAARQVEEDRLQVEALFQEKQRQHEADLAKTAEAALEQQRMSAAANAAAAQRQLEADFVKQRQHEEALAAAAKAAADQERLRATAEAAASQRQAELLAAQYANHLDAERNKAFVALQQREELLAHQAKLYEEERQRMMYEAKIHEEERQRLIDEAAQKEDLLRQFADQRNAEFQLLEEEREREQEAREREKEAAYRNTTGAAIGRGLPSDIPSRRRIPPTPPQSSDEEDETKNFRRTAKFGEGNPLPRYKAATLKEVDSIKLPPAPTPVGFSDWAALVVRLVSTGAGVHRDEAREWILKPFKRNVDEEDLKIVPRNLTSINEKLLTPLLALLVDSMARKWKIRSNKELFETGLSISSLPILRELYSESQSSPVTAALYSTVAIHELEFKGDHHLEQYLSAFEEAREACGPHLSELAMGQLLYEKLSKGKSKILDLELREFVQKNAEQQLPELLLIPAARHFMRMKQIKARDEKQKSLIESAIIKSADPPKPAGGAPKEQPPTQHENAAAPTGAAVEDHKSLGNCFGWLRGSCNVTNCRFQHVPKLRGTDKDAGLNNDTNKGQGSKDRAPSLRDGKGGLLPKGKTPCRFFARGQCQRKDCPFLHAADGKKSPRRGTAGAAAALAIASAAAAATGADAAPQMIKVDVHQDTGAATDFCGSKLAAHFEQFEVEPMLMATANGIIESTKACRIELEPGLTMTPRILNPDSPCCLSIGARNEHHDYWWPKNSDTAYLISDTGQTFTAKVDPKYIVPRRTYEVAATCKSKVAAGSTTLSDPKGHDKEAENLKCLAAKYAPEPNVIEGDEVETQLADLFKGSSASSSSSKSPQYAVAPSSSSSSSSTEDNHAKVGNDPQPKGGPTTLPMVSPTTLKSSPKKVGGEETENEKKEEGDEHEVKVTPPHAPRTKHDRDSTQHLVAHLPFSADCRACVSGKSKSSPHSGHHEAPTAFGEEVTGDFKIINEVNLGDSSSIQGDGNASLLVLKDVATSYSTATGCKTRATENVTRALQLFLDSKVMKRFHTDNADEFSAAAKAVEEQQGSIVQHTQSVPFDHQSNGVIERHIQLVSATARTLLARSGLGARYWSSASSCAAQALNHTLKNENLETPYGIKYPGKEPPMMVPFGARIEVIYPVEERRALDHPFSPNARTCVYAGYDESDHRYALYFRPNEIDNKTRLPEPHRIRFKDIRYEEPATFPYYKPPADGEAIMEPKKGDGQLYNSDGALRERGVNWWKPNRGSSRPSEIHPSLWQKATRLEAKEAIKMAKEVGAYHLNDDGTPDTGYEKRCRDVFCERSPTAAAPKGQPPQDVNQEGAETKSLASLHTETAETMKRTHRVHFNDKVDVVQIESRSPSASTSSLLPSSSSSSSSPSSTSSVGSFSSAALTTAPSSLSSTSPAGAAMGMKKYDSAPKWDSDVKMMDQKIQHSFQKSTFRERKEARKALMNLMAMPSGIAIAEPHRPKSAGDGATLPPLALIAKLLTAKEVRERPDAQQAIRDEGAKQKRMGTWDESEVVEKHEVLQRARRTSEKVHFDRCFAFASDKNSEADIGSRIVKGRMVLGGDRLQDQFGSAAAFSDIQMSPTTAAAIRLAIAIGSCPGGEAIVMDASAAYLQAPMKGPLTYITLPKELWPAHWHTNFRDPVVPLRKAMYGHPSSGLIWAEYCASKLLGVGFTPVAGWPSTFVNKAGVLLTLYVDDFLFAGKSEDVHIAAKAVSSVLDMGKTEA